MLETALIVLIVVVVNSLILIKLAFKPIMNKFTYDKSTNLLINQRKIKRSAMCKVDKAIKLNELDVEIDNHLRIVEVESAKALAKA